MTALPGRRRRNTLLALAGGLVAAILMPLLVYVGAVAISNSNAGENALSGVPPEQAFPQTPTGMLATVSDNNELTSVTVFVLAPQAEGESATYDQRGGSVVSVPININAGSEGQLLSLHDAYALGGEEELRADVESVLSLTLDNSAVMKEADFADFLADLPTVEVDFPRDVLGADDTVMYAKGPQSLSAQDVAKVITTRSATQPERLRQPNIDALWSGITAAIGPGRAGQTLSAGPPTTFAELAARLTAGQSASRGLIARQLGQDRNPEALDVEELDRPDALLVFASIAPAQMSRPGSGLTYRLEAPAGFDAQVRKLIAELLAVGGNVVSVDLNADSHPETAVFVYDPEIAAVEPTDNSILGPVSVETPDVRLGGVDETISLGTNYLNGVDLTAPDATSTSSTVAPPETTA
ncbi:MAG TPA: hypothetical protein VIK05_13495 [Ilumatobacteraceae bacterium]